MPSYDIEVFPEDEWLIINVPVLDIFTQAENAEEVVHMARDLIALWLDIDYDDVSIGKVAHVKHPGY
jgi:hypothetical protein